MAVFTHSLLKQRELRQLTTSELTGADLMYTVSIASGYTPMQDLVLGLSYQPPASSEGIGDGALGVRMSDAQM